ncbi:MAG: hypothetical protein ACRCYP_03680 [Alphaproteobacteria bacterium]
MKIVKVVEVKGLGDRIANARFAKCRAEGVTLESLFIAAEVSRPTWNRVEREAESVPLETLKRIVGVLGDKKLIALVDRL